ncbi:Bsp6I family type II restriction endonuclease [Candidatus Nitrosopelagicus sp.]|nr:Bsp6I family type II restriction endonuclease [Candidatus Nitrosopelagicus sp.]
MKIKREEILIEGKKYSAELQYFEKKDRTWLRELYQNWTTLRNGLINAKTRGPNFPEGISEVAFAIIFDAPRVLSVIGTHSSFDNYDIKKYKRIQVKATSVKQDLSSFGPKSVWDTLFFLDFYRDGKFDGKFDAYIIPNNLVTTQVVKQSTNETFVDYQKKGLRPRFSIQSKIIRKYNIKPTTYKI